MSTEEKLAGPMGCEHDEYDLPRALDLANQVIRLEIKHRMPTIGHDYPYVYCPSNRENVRIIKSRERVVATVGIYPTEVCVGDRNIRVGGINCLATDPPFRRRGLGSLVMRDAIKRMEELGCHISILGTKVPEFYRNLGWEYGGSVYRYSFDSGNIGLLAQRDIEIEPYSDSMLSAILQMYHRERLGAKRTERLLRYYFNQPARAYKTGEEPDHSARNRVMVGMKDGKLRAYIVVTGSNSVIEYAGDRNIVCELLRNLFFEVDDPGKSTTDRSHLRNPRIEVQVPPADCEFISRLEKMGVPRRREYQGMIRIIDLEGLLAAMGMEEVGVEALPESGYRLHRDNQNAVFNVREMVKLLFGPERPSNFHIDIFPLKLHQWSLDHV